MATLTVSKERDIFYPDSVSFEEREKQLQAQEKFETEARNREKKSPFSRWTQFNLEHTKKMMWLQLKYPKAAAIMSFLVDQMDEHNAVMCSYQVLQEVLGVGQATIARSIKVLKDNGYMAVLKSGSSNVYAVNDSVYWKSWGDKKQYSKFPANIILAFSEQNRDYQQLTLSKLEVTKHKEISVKTE